MAKPTTFKIKTVNGVRRQKIYYDADVFDETVLLSASLLISDKNIIDKDNINLHYNTINNEDNGVSGTDFSPLEDILIPIYPKPPKTKIIGANRVYEDAIEDFYIDNIYDQNNDYNYLWEVSGPALLNGGNGTSFLNGKEIQLSFQGTGLVTLKCNIINEYNCIRTIEKVIHSGIVENKLLVVRNIFF